MGPIFGPKSGLGKIPEDNVILYVYLLAKGRRGGRKKKRPAESSSESESEEDSDMDEDGKKQVFTPLDKQTFEREIVNIFLPISFCVCFWCSKEPSH